MIDFCRKKHLFAALLVLVLFALCSPNSLSANEIINEIRIPVYAAQTNGSPVTSFDQKELALYIDNAAVPFTLETVDETDRETGKLNIIILDSTLMEYNDFVTGKRLAEKLVKDCPQCDTFAIIQLSPMAGLHLAFPPGTNKELALAQINSLKQYPPMSERYEDRRGGVIWSVKPDRSRYYVRKKFRYNSLKEIKNLYRAEFYYETQVLRFSYLLSKFKKALSMIQKPKVVYLLSGSSGKEPPSAATDPSLTRREYEYTSFIKGFLKKLVKEINHSDCLLFAVDTQKQGDPLPAVRSFYQLKLNGTFKPGEKVSIKLDCTRDDIRLSYPGYIVPAKSYKFMDNRQKRLFLLDIIMEEPWIKLAAPVEKVPFKIIADSVKEKENVENNDTLNIKIPAQMYRGDVDVYTIYINPETRKTHIRFSPLIASDEVNVTIDKAKGKHRFFVVVEPAETYCIYNQVK